MKLSEFITESSNEKIDYVIYVNDKPATVYDTKPQAQADLDKVKKNHPHSKIVIKRRTITSKDEEV